MGLLFVFKDWLRRKKRQRRSTRLRSDYIREATFERGQVEGRDVAETREIKHLLDQADFYLRLSLEQWKSIHSERSVADFRRNVSDLHRNLVLLRTHLVTDVKRVGGYNDIDFLMEESGFLKKQQALPESLKYHLSDIPSLIEKEKAVTEQLKSFHLRLLKNVEDALRILEDPDKSFSFIGVVSEKLNYYSEHKAEYAEKVKMFVEVKNKIFEFGRMLGGETSRYIDNKRLRINQFREQLSEMQRWFYFSIPGEFSPPSLWDSSNEKRGRKERLTFKYFSCFGSEKIRVMEEILRKVNKLIQK